MVRRLLSPRFTSIFSKWVSGYFDILQRIAAQGEIVASPRFRNLSPSFDWVQLICTNSSSQSKDLSQGIDFLTSWFLQQFGNIPTYCQRSSQTSSASDQAFLTSLLCPLACPWGWNCQDLNRGLWIIHDRHPLPFAPPDLYILCPT